MIEIKATRINIFYKDFYHTKAGYPVQAETVEFRKGRAANKADYRVFYQMARKNATPELTETVQFLVSWAGEPAS
jgi:hypothetical protein